MVVGLKTDKCLSGGAPLPRALHLDHTNWEDRLDSRIWTGESFSEPTTLDAYPASLGTQPTAKSSLSAPSIYSLPGAGEPYSHCGDDVLYLCPVCETTKKGKRCCRRGTCPKCYTTWAWLQARRSALRILEARRIFASQLGRAHRPIHVMISLPRHRWDLFNGIKGEHLVSQEGYWRKPYTRKDGVKVKPAWIPPKTYLAKDTSAREEAYKLLTQAGLRGALLIPHPWRLKCASCGGEIIGSWRVDKETGKFVLKDRRCVNCSCTAYEWVDGPHFHAVGYGWIEHTKEIEQDTGYIIKNIGVCDNVGGTIWYQLTHCGIQTGRQTVTYFGLCALNKYESPKVPKELPLCPRCGAIMTVVEATDKPPPLT